MRHEATISVKGTYTGEEMGEEEEEEEEEERWGKKEEEERKKERNDGTLSAKLYKVLKRRDVTSQNEKWLFWKISRE